MRRRSGMTLILVLLVMLIGGAFVYVAFTMAENAHNSSMNMVTQDRLYNAAQSGLEWGKTKLLEHRDDIDSDLKTFDGNMKSIFGTYTPVSGTQERLDYTEEPGYTVTDDGTEWIDPATESTVREIRIQVQILDTNFDPNGHSDPVFPPMVPISGDVGSGTGVGGSQIGFSNLLDPNRNISMGGGTGAVQHAFAIRSVARVNWGTSDEREFGVETMVVMPHE